MLSEQLPEVVEVFTGDTLEEAMAYAVAALGPDLSVRRARKVRKGVQGLVGKDRYEVVAVPPPGAPSTDAVASAFDALLDQAEKAETPVRRDDRPRSPHPAPSVAEHAAPARPRVQRAPRALPAEAPAPEAPAPSRARATKAPVRRTTRTAAPAPAPAPPPVSPPPATRSTAVAKTARAKAVPAKTAPAKTAPAKTVPAKAAGAAPARRTPAPRKAAAAVVPATAPARRRGAVPPGWSREALVALGLPEQVLQALPAQDPLDDLAWVVALAVAISSVLPEPAALGPDHPLVVDGYGVQGVLGLLDAAARGLTPGTITVGDRTAPATATELALAVRTAVVG